MKERATLEVLLARVLEGEGPDRELDAEIALAVGYTREKKGRERIAWWRDPKGQQLGYDGWHNFPPAFTRSLDAAVTLVPEGWGWAVSTTGAELPCAYGHPPGNVLTVSWIDDTSAATAALAICAFALRARAATAQPSSDT